MTDIVQEARVMAMLVDHEPIGSLSGVAALISQLADIVERLPVTADGVPITVGMNLAIIHNVEGPLDAGVLSVELGDYPPPMVATVRTTDGREYSLNVDACYSTLAAAERSRE